MAWAVRCTDDFRRYEVGEVQGRFFGACSQCGGQWPYIVTGFYESNVEAFDALVDHMRLHVTGSVGAAA